MALIFAGLWQRESAEPPLPVALEVSPPKGSRFPNPYLRGSAISPNGRTLAFTARNEKGESHLYVRPLESLTARALSGTEAASLPFWSPDGKSLAFFAKDMLNRLDPAGGAPVTLCKIAGVGMMGEEAGGAAWNEEGVLLFGATANSLYSALPALGIQRIPASGGTPVTVTRIHREAGEFHHLHPQFLPGGRDFLYLVRHRDPSKSGIALASLDSKAGEGGPAPIVARTEYMARYDAASSMLLYIQGHGTLMARRLEFDPPRLVGDPAVVAEGVRTNSYNASAGFSISRQGTLFYSQGVARGEVRFGWRGRSGQSLELIGEPVPAVGPFALSPDGTRVVYSASAGRQTDVWMMDLSRGLRTRFSFNGGYLPRWSPDGRFVYYGFQYNGIFRKPADGAGEEVLLAKAGYSHLVHTVSPDGKALLFGFGEIRKLPLAVGDFGEAKPEEYLKTSFREGWAAFSPDGRWVAYRSDESGRAEIYIQGYPDKRGKWPVSASGGQHAAWRPDGKELYWNGLDGVVMAAGIELQRDGVRVGRPQPLFPLPSVLGAPVFQPSRDGQRFLVYEPASATSENEPMVVIQNWAARLEK